MDISLESLKTVNYESFNRPSLALFTNLLL